MAVEKVMPARKRFVVEGKKVFAYVSKLTENDLKTINNYIALGYELVEAKPPKKADTDIAWKEETIRAWLKENGTAAQQAKYEELYNEPVKDNGTGNSVYKKDVYEKETIIDEDGKEKTRIKQPKTVIHHKGDTKKRGHINTLKWFKETFKDYPPESK